MPDKTLEVTLEETLEENSAEDIGVNTGLDIGSNMEGNTGEPLWLASAVLDWRRGNHMQNPDKNPDENPGKKPDRIPGRTPLGCYGPLRPRPSRERGPFETESTRSASSRPLASALPSWQTPLAHRVASAFSTASTSGEGRRLPSLR